MKAELMGDGAALPSGKAALRVANDRSRFDVEQKTPEMARSKSHCRTTLLRRAGMVDRHGAIIIGGK